MKTEFPGYFPISEAGQKAAWKNGLFSFDASVLLDLYRYSDETRQELLKLFKSLGGRIWITHQAAQEFLDGRLGVIASQSKLYDDSLILIDRVEKMFKSARGHPFLTKELLTETDTHFKKLRSYLNSKKSHLDRLISKDPIEEEVASLLKGHIGPAFPKKRLTELFAEGETRYKEKIPPGYEDAKKPEGNSRFGDLVMWFQLIEKAQKEKKPITFVTADDKEDWWKIFQGKTIGSRPELIAEFREKTGVDFQMFSLESFMKAAAEKLAHKVKEDAIQEVKEVRKEAISLGALAALERMEKARRQATPSYPFPEYGYSGYQNTVAKQLGLDAESFRKALAETAPGVFYEQLLHDEERLRNLKKHVAPLGGVHEELRKGEEQIRDLRNQLNPGLEIYEKLLAEQERIRELEKKIKGTEERGQI